MPDEFPQLKRAASVRRDRAVQSLRAESGADDDTVELDDALAKARTQPPAGRSSKPTVEG